MEPIFRRKSFSQIDFSNIDQDIIQAIRKEVESSPFSQKIEIYVSDKVESYCFGYFRVEGKHATAYIEYCLNGIFSAQQQKGIITEVE